MTVDENQKEIALQKAEDKREARLGLMLMFAERMHLSGMNYKFILRELKKKDLDILANIAVSNDVYASSISSWAIKQISKLK